jgi:predicted DNA-binding protein (MmcQ/YjbR family)
MCAPFLFSSHTARSRRRRARNGENAAVRLEAIAERVRSSALEFPGTYEDRPWGDFPVFKVGENKVFGWAVVEDGAVHVTMKLTAEEREIAHLLPYVRTASYVGRYGWITAAVTDEESLDAALEWLRESYWLKCPAELKAAVEGDD